MSEPASWAKAPLPERQDARARLHEATRHDRQHYLEAGFQEHRCESCGYQVLVCKTSPRHTSIQWTAEAAGGCPELTERDGRVAGCEKLAASIEQAVRSERLRVSGGGTA